MSSIAYSIVAVILALAILYGLHLMSNVKKAVAGNLISAAAMAVAILITMWKDNSFGQYTIWIAVIVGVICGLTLSNKVKMIQMPQLVAFLHGFGGGAAAIVGLIMLAGVSSSINAFERVDACLALCSGMTTIAGSFVAAGKLHQVLPQKPIILPRHSLIANILLAVMAVVLVCYNVAPNFIPGVMLTLMFLSGALFGIVFTLRVGGADMPITISLLNSMGGISCAIAGFAVSDPLLIAVGGIVGSAGYMLTRVMCKAMNRRLMPILLGESSVAGMKKPQAAPQKAAPAPSPAPVDDNARVGDMLRKAKKVIIVPGYGMALAQAQHKVKQLADALEANGAKVDYAIHPVAGRMPGHMNVLLAEADVDYEHLLEMDAVNPQFPDTDLVIIVGANDVVNPAANTAEGTPIYGMPVLDVDKAKDIIICNYDEKPGYAGVDNPLYTRPGVVMKLGDAGKTVGELVELAKGETPKAADKPAPAVSDANRVAKMLKDAKKVIIVPGYGMALAQAQHKVKQLADALEANGAKVDYAIHPVAGRMPGHMNVLLAEADVDYEHLLEMDAVNPQFPDTDLVIIVGANDVVNPAANTAEGTPIYGMPVLDVDKAKDIIICNYDEKPGYAGVDNPLYTRPGVVMKLGDAGKTVGELVELAKGEVPATPDAPQEDAMSGKNRVAKILKNAKKVIIVPGYGMALAQAQHKVKQLADALEANGAKVDYAIHPVAGRMPGHMNVLLAEADVDYEHLLEMDVVNPQFPDTDLAIVVGANDVVNPAANTAEGTPIYGMPVLDVDKAKDIIICNYDEKPGYAGVDNPLYTRPGVVMMLGDAAKTVGELTEALTSPEEDDASAKSDAGAASEKDAGQMLKNAKKVIIVPGYGMALAQAQHKVKRLADALEANGAKVDYAIHPVAGRMPGHMNVLLAEADVDYEHLLEMDAVNPQFQDTDLVIVVGANDVVNPAANTAEGTPIYGMPVLNVDKAKDIIICNYDEKPGYAGVDNPLYTRQGVVMMLGDASQSLDKLLDALNAAK